MRDLSQLPIFKNSESILADLKEYQDKPEMQEGCKSLVNALHKAEMASSVFFHDDLPKYALIALQDEEINEAQFISMLLIWGAFKDYPQKEQISCQTYHLTEEDKGTKQQLNEFLRIQHVGDNFFGHEVLNDEMDQQAKERLFQSLFNKDVPESERCFYTFTVKNPGEPFGIFEAIARTGFDLFMPRKKKDGAYEFIIPSMTMIQSTLNVLAQKPKKLVARIGDDDFDEVYEMHKQDAHPFGLSFPGKYEKTEADNLKSGRFGFALHDLYHVVLLSFTSEAHKAVFNSMIDLGKKLHAAANNQHKRSYSEAIGSLIDNEFRQFVRGYTLGQATTEQQKRLLNSNEFAVITGMVSLLVKATYYSNQINDFYLEDEKQRGEAEEELIKKIEQINPKHALAEKLQFCCELFAQIFQSNGMLNQQQVQLNRLVDILFSEETVAKTFELDKLNALDFSGFMDAYKITFGVVQQQMLRCLQDPENQKKYPWLKNYFGMAKQFQEAVQSNNVEQIKKLLSDKEYLKYYLSVDRIHGVEPSLVEQAVQLGHIDMVRLLHSAGASLNSLMLIQAVKNKDLKTLQYLLEEGTNPCQPDEKGLTVVDYCLESGDIKGLKAVLAYTSLGRHHLEYLRAKGLKIHPDCLPVLARYDQFKTSLYDIRDCFDADKRKLLLEELVQSNTDGFSYLTQTEFDRSPKEISSSHPEFYQSPSSHMYRNVLSRLEVEEICFLNKHQKLNFNQIDEVDNSVFINLITESTSYDEKKEIERYRLLVTLGADVKYVNPKGESALCQVFKENKFHLVEPLVQDGAKFHFEAAGSMYLNSLLSYLANHPEGSPAFKDALTLMLAHGFDLNKNEAIAISKGWFDLNPTVKFVSPWALMRDNNLQKVNVSPCLRILCVEHGADPNELSFSGNLELNVAINKGWDDYIMLLLSKGADPNKTDSNGLTPLHAAAKKGDEKMMSLLKSFGAQSTVNWRDKTPEEVLKETRSELPVSTLGLFKPVGADISEQQVNHTASLN
ncbi:ankyrin repeat domain-containing protein [Legionella sp. PATHC035]|uniref:ankyrin repeat domain-containing protein n=1 Tax=Legionella sp. PATHC035 TaxID=2992040 RepID=UPI002243324A|nr:ankyrin repeat domain-containing protein [Legionella sp. PATHC035]MCW8408865.1 ankyrin repeat domain-containing protein [Legionella sp. PATHC035]